MFNEEYDIVLTSSDYYAQSRVPSVAGLEAVRINTRPSTHGLSFSLFENNLEFFPHTLSYVNSARRSGMEL